VIPISARLERTISASSRMRSFPSSSMATRAVTVPSAHQGTRLLEAGPVQRVQLQILEPRHDGREELVGGHVPRWGDGLPVDHERSSPADVRIRELMPARVEPSDERSPARRAHRAFRLLPLEGQEGEKRLRARFWERIASA
jgi:hypothetical protein